MPKWLGVLMAMSLSLGGCTEGRPQPVPIQLNEDMCAFCRMAISEKRFAAEMINVDGEVFKFDDIGCMIRFVRMRQQKETARAFFVNDYHRRQWLEAERAFFVYARELRTPMDSHLVAFRERGAAEAFARDHRGQVLRWDDLWEKWDR
ncbi:MAG: hypothetical protein D6723_19045 [Acidobacteria bacterium]|nr:MAG: hypothetical protein D6723_19045 [Acidobacteriota bacterium]